MIDGYVQPHLGVVELNIENRVIVILIIFMDLTLRSGLQLFFFSLY